MKNLAFVLVLLALPACGTKYITDLPLVWEGGDKPVRPSASVGKALAATPLEPGEFKDARTAGPTIVGTYEDDGFKVQTKGDVRAFWAGRQRILLEGAGGRFQAPGQARLDAELLQLDVLEGNLYQGTARVKFTVTRKDGAAPPWTKAYEGKAKRWGRTHSAENFSEALSHALAEATKQLLTDEAFAAALLGQPTPAETPAPKGSGASL